jgi:predicted Zn finger-like uncharacterized protein
MKITCQACAAKYTIADEKVLGKIVKIRCKKCGATIVVNGNDPSASAGAAATDAPRAFDYAAQGAQGEPWTVNVADGDQRTMTDVEIADAYHAGVVNDETFCWKDGMTDWLPLREIEQLYAACMSTRATAAPHMGDGGAVDDGGVTKVQRAPIFGSSPPPAPAPYAAPRPAAGVPGNGGVAAAQALPAAPAARRAGGRAPAADLFGAAAQAGGEDDVMTSAPAGMPQVHEDPQRLTGARNENSVLFSLSALTSKSPSPSNRPMAASAEASGLIDIRNLGAQIGLGEDKKKSRIDDIMNLAGGGAFSPSLGAPVLSAPPIEEYAPAHEATGARAAVAPAAGKSKALIFGAIGAGAVVIVGALGAAVMFMGSKSDTADRDKTGASATAATSASVAAATPAPSGTDSTASTAAPPPDSAATASAAAPTGTTTATAATTKPTTTTAAAAAAATKPPTATATATTPAATATAAAAPPATTAAAAGGSDQPFNMGEAKARLAAIAGSVQGCKKGDASGSGRVVVTFAPGGNVQSAVVSGPPFEGTPTGACVASRFRGARVPPFSGSPFSVSKSFTIN